MGSELKGKGWALATILAIALAIVAVTHSRYDVAFWSLIGACIFLLGVVECNRTLMLAELNAL